MKYRLNDLPKDWIESDLISDATASIVQLLISNWGDRPIPATAFFQLAEHRDILTSIGWLVEVES